MTSRRVTCYSNEPLAGLVITPAVSHVEAVRHVRGAARRTSAAMQKYCLDMSKRGGANTLRPCVKRACLRPLDGSQAKPSSPRAAQHVAPPAAAASPRVHGDVDALCG